MERLLQTGNEAVALGALHAGVAFASAYPGTPSTEILEEISTFEGVYAEWAPNEKVALEAAVGASIGGVRSLAAMKHVGLNVAADPWFTLPYIGVVGGLVVVSADDPGMHSSQNEQDNRYYAKAAKVPMLEPADSQEAYDLVREAFGISERFDTPVLLRLTTRVCHSRSLVETRERESVGRRAYEKDEVKRVMIPGHARLRHPVMVERLEALEELSEEINRRYDPAAAKSDSREGSQPSTSMSCLREGSQPSSGSGPERPASKDTVGESGPERPASKDTVGESGPERPASKDTAEAIVITSGVAYQYAREAFPLVDILKLVMTNPLPRGLIRETCARYGEVFVVEELEPFLEEAVSALGFEPRGKDRVPRVGELNVDNVREAFGELAEGAQAYEGVPEVSGLPARPPILCAGCPHRGIMYVLARLKAIIAGDIGCYTLSVLPPLSAHDCQVCMGASITMGHGLEKAFEMEMVGDDGEGGGRRARHPVVAVLGDSTFFHSGVTGLMEMAYNRGTFTVVILDNRTTAMTGFQNHPGTGTTLQGEPGDSVDIEMLAHALGIESVRVVDPWDLEECARVLSEEMDRDAPSVVISRRPCVLLDRKSKLPPFSVIREACNDCGLCMRIACPALVKRGDEVTILTDVCAGCGVCAQVCRREAIAEW